MPEIKLRISQADLDRLNAEAALLGVPRAQLIRDRALSPAVARLSTVEYHRLVADAVTATRGDLPRLQVEYLVAYVITRLDQAVTRHQPTP
jgi:hypothetical protein